MIEERFIESANEIRKEYLRLSEELNTKEKILNEFKTFISDKLNELSDFKDKNSKSNKPKTKEEVISLSNELISKLSDIEEKERGLSNRIQDIDNRMNKLQNEEIELLRKIQTKYPKLSIEEIKKEIHSRISY